MVSPLPLLAAVTLFFALVTSVSPAAAGEASGQGFPENPISQELSADDEELQRLLEILDEQTEIATRTRLNADYVPGMVTVLYGDELLSRGVRTVWEALGLAPGMTATMSGYGIPQVLTRGLAEAFVSGNIKFLLNSVPMNIAVSSRSSSFLQLPVSQIERIEIIRGPGSAIHGEFAYTGVVNVVTKSDENRVFASAGSYDTYGTGGFFSWSSPGDKLSLGLNLGGWRTDGADMNSGPDLLHGMGMAAISNAPGPANEDMESLLGVFNLSYSDFSLLVQYMEQGLGDHFGVNNVLPFADDRIVTREGLWIVQIGQRLELGSSLRIDLTLGNQWYRSYNEKAYLVFPPRFLLIYTDGMMGKLLYEEKRAWGEVLMTWEGWNRHAVLLGCSIARTDIGDTWQEINYDPSTRLPLPSLQRFDGAQNWIARDRDRLVNSLILQDEFRLNPKLTFTAGLRYDHYDDVGDSLTPRVAGVWRVTDHHILKAQYARAFRPPTFLEMYMMNNPVAEGNPDIEPSTVDTFEAGYLYKAERTTGRLSLFYSRLDDLIVVDSGQYANGGGAHMKGVELELEQALFSVLKLEGNLSYVHTQDRVMDEAMPGSANWLANVGLMYQPHRSVMLSLQYRYVGKRSREPLDARADLDAYHTLDVTGCGVNLGLAGLTLRAGVKNLLDEDVRYPAPMGSDLSGEPIPTYPEDFPRPGRQWWAEISYDF